MTDVPRTGLRPRPERLVAIPGGRAVVGTDRPELPGDGEGPSRAVSVRPFLIDPWAVTNADFAAFVAETGYVTEAERIGWSAVFHAFVAPALQMGARSQNATWWVRVDGAAWSRPEGSGSSTDGRERHPVVHVSLADTRAYAAWAGGRLPTEAEWEHAAAGGNPGIRFPWGDREPDEAGFLPCNIWQGTFPVDNTAADGFRGTAPVDAYQANGYGLHNMCGNAWEWTSDAFRIQSLSRQARERNDAARRTNARVMKGGSYLCHRSYCYRYRIAARSAAPPDTATGHLGFRLVYDP